MKRIDYSSLQEEAKRYWEWSESTPVVSIPTSVAREGAGSEMRTPLMHYGVVVPVYLSVARYLTALQPKKGMRLIELGSGSGRPLAYIKTLFPDLEVWGVDYSKGGVEYAKLTYGKYGIKFKHVPAQDTSLKNNYFDFVMSSHVIEHLTKEDGLLFMQEANRILKKGGLAFVGTPERRNCQEIYAENPSDHKKFRLVSPHEHEYTLQELKTLAQKVFPKENVRVDALQNPTFLEIFTSSIEKIKPKDTVKGRATNFAYRTFRDKAPRHVFDAITRIGAKVQMKKANCTFQDILFDNRVAAESKDIPANLLLVCKKS